MEFTSSESKRNSLMSNLKAVIEDAEDLLRSTGQQASQQADDTYRSARAKFEQTLQSAKSGLGTMQQTAAAKTKGAVTATDQYVKANPWQSVGIGAAAGLVIGFLLMRR